MSCKCGMDNCGLLCNYSVGARLFNFLSKNKFAETSIGDIESDTIDKRQKFIVIGSEISEDGVGKLMVPLGKYDIPLEKKFRENADAKAALREYMNKEGITDREIMDKLVKFENNKLVAIPILAGTTCDISYINDTEKITEKGKVVKIRWTVDKKDRSFRCDIVTDVFNRGTNRRIVLGMDDIGYSIKQSDISGFYNKSHIDGNLIKYSKAGYIMPIEFQDKITESSIIFDGMSVYLRGRGDYRAQTVGGWHDKTLEYDEGKVKKYIKNEKILKIIKNNKVYLKLVRNRIAPYLMADTHKVKLR